MRGMPGHTVIMTCRSEVSDPLTKRPRIRESFAPVASMQASVEPLLYAVGLKRGTEHHSLIEASGVMALNFISSHSLGYFISEASERHSADDPFDTFRIAKSECHSIDCPRIAEADSWLECHVESIVDAGDSVLLLARILHTEDRPSGQNHTKR